MTHHSSTSLQRLSSQIKQVARLQRDRRQQDNDKQPMNTHWWKTKSHEQHTAIRTELEEDAQQTTSSKKAS